MGLSIVDEGEHTFSSGQGSKAARILSPHRPFFKKSERFHAPATDIQRAAGAVPHDVVGSDGPIHISYPFEYTASHGLWHKTLDALGIPSNNAHLAGSNIGAWTTVCSVDPSNATRSYAATGYYLPNAHRPNLVLLTGAEVHELLLNKDESGDAWVASGVRFSHGGSDFRAFASQEVILSAGSVQSPQLLERSGIGGASVLSAAGISLKVDNPNVGEHLQDHLSMLPTIPPASQLAVDRNGHMC